MNIYQMYHKNDCKFGFFVIRDSWGNTIAKILSIEGVNTAEKIKEIPPYFSNPKVKAEFYKIQNARRKNRASQFCISENLTNVGELPYPGTHVYEMI